MEFTTTKECLDTFKVYLGKFLDEIADNLPVTGYTTRNSNSVLNWSSQSGGLREKLTAL